MTKLDELRERFAAHKAALERWSEWCPNRPFAKQREFIDMEDLEVLYGGAAGGGKTDALLAAALRYVDKPGYSALLLRRTTTDLKLPGALLDRSHTWLDGTRAHWIAQDKRWLFPTGGKPASIQFGYCESDAHLQRYKSAEFQCIGIDELTEWPEGWYTYLFSRLRGPAASSIPLRMRSCSNPDGIGYGWVRKRFGIPENERVDAPIRGKDTVFFPARAEDNPAINLADYERALEKMAGGRGGIKWRQLRDGIWIPDGAGLVYVYNAAKNSVPPFRWKNERARWHFILGIDYGYTNACGFAVIAWRDDDPNVYIVEAFTLPELEPTAAAEIVQGLEREYAFGKIVGDVGGLGKGYAEEGRKRWTLPIEPAQKVNKRGYQVLFNDALFYGRIKLVEATTKDLRDEWEVLPWAEGRKEEAAGFANHASDATLYAWREAPNYHDRLPAEQPKPGTREAYEAEEKRLEEALEEELEADGVAERSRAVPTFWR